MLNEFILKIQKTEKLAGICPEEYPKEIPYKVFNNVWIRADKSIMEIYSKSLINSEVVFYPNLDYKAWVVWFLKLIKLKKSSQTFQNLIGLKIKWPFVKKQFLPLKANIIYYRTHSVILVYSTIENKKVVKLALSSWGDKIMSSEIMSQKCAHSIKSDEIFIPEIINEIQYNDINVTIEEYFEGRKQSFSNKKILESNYQKVYRFLLEFYLKNKIELQGLSESKFINHDFVHEFINNQKYGDLVLSIFKNLYSKEMKMIMCRIHGDLSHNNILSNKEQICIIDWGKSKQHYLAIDLDNSSYNTESVYDELVQRAEINEKDIYSYLEQLFLSKFIEMSRLIHNGIIRKSVSDRLELWTKSQNAEFGVANLARI